MHKCLARESASRAAGLAVSLVLAALALAALDEGTTGSEPDFVGEWCKVELAGAWFAGGGAAAWKRLPRARTARPGRTKDARS